MFCHNCSCELPAIAKFCVRCGALVGPAPGFSPTQRLFCVNCGKPYEPSHKFCNFCGSLVIQAPGQVRTNPVDSIQLSEPAIEAVPVEAPAQIVLNVPQVNRPPEPAPYAKFVLSFLCSVLLIAGAIFGFADALVRHQWDGTVWIGLSLLAAIFLAVGARKYLKRILIVETKSDAKFKRRHRHVAVTSAVVVVVFFTIAAATGTAIAQKRTILVTYNTDLEREVGLADRLGKAQSAGERTIASQLQVYAAIEPIVLDYESTLIRLRTETGSYDTEFPENHQRTSENIGIFEHELKRSRILKQEIDVAKQIGALDSDGQMAAWRSDMQPLLDQENALDSAR
jgi:hypothetical protein